MRATSSAASAARTQADRCIAPSQVREISSSISTLKSRSSFASEPAPPTPGDVPVINTKGKGLKGASKGQKGAATRRGYEERSQLSDDRRYTSSTGNQEMPGEKFEEDTMKANMQRAVQRCKDTISNKTASYGRADPCEFMTKSMGRITH